MDSKLSKVFLRNFYLNSLRGYLSVFALAPLKTPPVCDMLSHF